MHTVVAIFTSQEAAEHAAARLGSLGIPREQLNFLMPGAPTSALAEVPTTETEQPGMGAALGSMVGGAAGAEAIGVEFFAAPGLRMSPPTSKVPKPITIGPA